MVSVKIWPMPVASAAPAMPIFGNGPMPKISIGSRMILQTEPAIRPTIVTRMRPTAWKIFSNASAAIMTVENINAMLA